MVMKKVYYTIESSKEVEGQYVLWKNTENIKNNIGSFGCYKVFRGLKKDIKEYCKENKIRVKGGIRWIF